MITRSKLNLQNISISALSSTTISEILPDKEEFSSDDINTTMARVSSINESDADDKKQINEMLHIDQWLLDLFNVYEELYFPMLFRVYNVTQCFLEEEKVWYEQEKYEIKESYNSNYEKHQPIVDLHDKKYFTDNLYLLPDNDNSSFNSHLSATMAQEMIRSPTYFRGRD
ncbi:unnamed protein product, partial [Rotaria socialis]|uniref:Uncharacterized protein n=2 Tax=Rotaria socialis TaxID=392032 RepID=A0A821WH81_9BILA